MPKMSKLEKELQLATGVKQDDGEAEQAYLLHLVTGVADLPEKAWDGLSEPAQEWYNAAASAIEASTPIAKFDVETTEPQPSTPEIPSTSKENTMSNTKKSKAKSTTKTDKRGKSSTKPKEKKLGVCSRLFTFFVEKPTATPQDGVTAIVKAGLKVSLSTATAIQHSVSQTIAAQSKLKR